MSSGRPKCCSVIAASAVPRTIPRAEDSTAGTEHSGDAPAVANPQPSGCEPAAECCGGTFRSQLAHAQAHTLRRRYSSVQVRFSNRRESKVLAPKAWRSARGAGSAWRFRPSQKPMVKYSFRRSPIRKEFDISQCEGSCIEPEICATGISSLSIPRVEQGPPTTVVKAVIGHIPCCSHPVCCCFPSIEWNKQPHLQKPDTLNAWFIDSEVSARGKKIYATENFEFTCEDGHSNSQYPRILPPFSTTERRTKIRELSISFKPNLICRTSTQ